MCCQKLLSSLANGSVRLSAVAAMLPEQLQVQYNPSAVVLARERDEQRKKRPRAHETDKQVAKQPDPKRDAGHNFDSKQPQSARAEIPSEANKRGTTNRKLEVNQKSACTPPDSTFVEAFKSAVSSNQTKFSFADLKKLLRAIWSNLHGSTNLLSNSKMSSFHPGGQLGFIRSVLGSILDVNNQKELSGGFYKLGVEQVSTDTKLNTAPETERSGVSAAKARRTAVEVVVAGAKSDQRSEAEEWLVAQDIEAVHTKLVQILKAQPEQKMNYSTCCELMYQIPQMKQLLKELGGVRRLCEQDKLPNVNTFKSADLSQQRHKTSLPVDMIELKPKNTIFNRLTKPHSTKLSEETVLPNKPPFSAYIGNLRDALDEVQLKKFFGSDCVVSSVKLLASVKSTDKQSGYVEFADQQSLANALKYDGWEDGGVPVTIRYIDWDEALDANKQPAKQGATVKPSAVSKGQGAAAEASESVHNELVEAPEEGELEPGEIPPATAMVKSESRKRLDMEVQSYLVQHRERQERQLKAAIEKKKREQETAEGLHDAKKKKQDLSSD